MFESKMRQMESDLLKIRNTLEELNSGYLNDAGILHFKRLLLRQMYELERAVADVETALGNDIMDLESDGEGEDDGNEE